MAEEVEDGGSLEVAEEKKRKREKRSRRVVKNRELFICETEENRGMVVKRVVR